MKIWYLEVKTTNSPIEYEQTDSRWRNIMYSPIGNRNDTIGNSGCGPTCAAMVMATLRDRTVTPKEAAAWAIAKGYVSPHDGTYWGFFKAYFAANGIECQQIVKAEADRAIAALKKDRMVIAAMGEGDWTSIGHFILAYGIVGDKVKIHDPNSEASYRELGNLTHFKTQAAQFWIIPEAWMVKIKSLQVKSLDNNANISVNAVEIDGTNYVKLRDMEKLAPVKIGNEGAVPTIKNDSVKDLSVKDLDKKQNVTVAAVNVAGTNYVKLRDLEKLAPVDIGNEGAVPTIKANLKKV